MKQRARTPIATTLFALVLAACTGQVRESASLRSQCEVGVEELTATIASSLRIMLADNENVRPPLAESGNRPPAYPAELLSQRFPPQAVCLRVSISEAA